MSVSINLHKVVGKVRAIHGSIFVSSQNDKAKEKAGYRPTKVKKIVLTVVFSFFVCGSASDRCGSASDRCGSGSN